MQPYVVLFLLFG